MSNTVTLNGSSYTIPDVGESNWGQNVTDYLKAIPAAVLQKSGGSFTLTAEVDFGGTYGLKSAYFLSRTSNPASAGAVRLARADVVSWRNQANGANVDLGVDASNDLTWATNKVITVAGGFTSVGTNTYANQKGIRFMEQTGNGTNYIEIVAPDAVTSTVTLKLPDGVGSAGQVLSTDGAGAMSWIAASGGGVINTGTQGRLAIYSSTGTTLDDVVTMTNTVTVDIAAHGQGSVYTIPDTGSATANFVMTAGNQSLAGQKTFTGTITITNGNSSVFAVTTNSTFKIDSTNVLVSIGTTTMTYPLYISKSSAGANVTLALENSESANAASHARLYIISGGASGGDPFITLYNGVTNWSIGQDNSDSDALCITVAATLNGTNLWRMTTAGAITQTGALTVQAASTAAIFINSTFVGDNPGLNIQNDDNTDANSGARIVLRSGGTSAGDPAVRYRIGAGAGQEWSHGVDNSASDRFIINPASSLGGSNAAFIYDATGWIAIGPNATYTANYFSLQTDGAENAAFWVKVNNATGDPFIRFTTNSTDWSLGADNSASDSFVLAKSSALGTTDILTISTASEVTLNKLAGDGLIACDVYSANTGNATYLKFRKSQQDTIGFTATGTGSFLGVIEFYGTNSGNTAFARGATIRAIQTGSAGATHLPGELVFLTSDGTATQAERMTIKPSGFIGINTTGPECLLHVFNATAGTFTATSTAFILIENSANAFLQTATPNTATVGLLFGDPESNIGGYFQYNHNTNAFLFGVNAVQLYGADSTGWTLHGTTKTLDSGTNANAWDDVWADDFQNVADIPFFDYVKGADGEMIPVDDLAVIRNIRPLRDEKGDLLFNENGHAYWDDSSLPEWVFTRDKRNPSELSLDPEGKPWISMKVLAGLSLGAVGQVVGILDIHSASLADHETRIAALEKAAA